MLWRCCTVCTLLAPATTHAALLSHCFCPALCGLINGDHVDRETINLHFHVLQQWFHYDRFTSSGSGCSFYRIYRKMSRTVAIKVTKLCFRSYIFDQ